MKLIGSDNPFTKMQKDFYCDGTSNHEELNNHDDYWNVLISNKQEIIKDLEQIGFVDISCETHLCSEVDPQHPEWIYIKCYKK